MPRLSFKPNLLASVTNEANLPADLLLGRLDRLARLARLRRPRLPSVGSLVQVNNRSILLVIVLINYEPGRIFL